MNTKALGNAGEDVACAYLRKKGYAIEGRNVRRGGCEVDVIARKGSTLAFVEVKTRTSEAHGTPAEAVDLVKQRRIARAAALYLQQKGDADSMVRFDVIEVTPEGVNHILAAFDTPGYY